MERGKPVRPRAGASAVEGPTEAVGAAGALRPGAPATPRVRCLPRGQRVADTPDGKDQVALRCRRERPPQPANIDVNRSPPHIRLLWPGRLTQLLAYRPIVPGPSIPHRRGETGKAWCRRSGLP